MTVTYVGDAVLLHEELLDEELLDEERLDEELLDGELLDEDEREEELVDVRGTVLELDELELDEPVGVMIKGAELRLDLVLLDDACCAASDETRLVLGGAVEDKSEGLDVVVCSL